jgi:hypothetical protein
MFLRDLAITTPRKSKFVFGHNGITPGIEELYLFCLGKFYSGQFAKVIVEVGGKGDRSLDKMVDVIRISEEFDFEKYAIEDISGKRKMVIDVLQSGLLAISIAEGWESKRLTDAYECCLSRNLEFKYIFKEKYWRAPSRQAYAAIYCCYEVEQFEAYVIFFDKNKHEICRRKLMDSPYWNLDPFGQASWSEDSNQFIVYTKDKRKNWTAVLNN